MPIAPTIIPLRYQPDSQSYFEALAQFDHRVWLDSARPASLQGRYDIISASPVSILSEPNEEQIQAALASLQHNLDLSSPELKSLPFCGGLIGYFNYESQHANLRLRTRDKNEKQRKNKKSKTGVFDWCLIVDHELKTAQLIFLPTCDSSKKENILHAFDEPNTEGKEAPFKIGTWQNDQSKQAYLTAYEKIQSYILEGDTYQINYTQRFSANFEGSPAAAYSHLRKTLPCAYSAFIQLDSSSILSFSPEQFISIKNNKATTKPIKGTVARGESTSADKALAQQLLQSPKNRAENLMIVDLMRNDFSRSCKPHSVKVPSLFNLESFKNVHHLVSTVCGELEDDINPLTFFLRCFPGGSITGAPKLRAMEIIDELELNARNIYCGSIYYQSVHNHFDSNIAIRTTLIDDGKIYCWGGGGIVADSDAEEEYEESIQKISILLNA